jgi:uncharacterized membrane protein required for colicin V production
MLDSLKSAPLVDIVILIGFGGCFVLGFAQGAIRRILGILSIVFAFLVAANLRDPLGNYLAENWRQFDADYNHLLAFSIVFVVGAVVSSIVIQGFYKRTELNANHPILDDVVGGLLGLVQGLILLIFVVIILNSSVMSPARSGDVAQFRYVHDLIVDQSHIADAIRTVVAPPLMHVLSFLMPTDLVSMFP